MTKGAPKRRFLQRWGWQRPRAEITAEILYFRHKVEATEEGSWSWQLHGTESVDRVSLQPKSGSRILEFI